MPFIKTNELETGQRLPGWTHRLFSTENMTFAHFDFEAGAKIHEHSHSNEEVWTVIEGELLVSVGADSVVAGPGLVAVVPPYMPHSIKALTDGKAIVTDSPVRVDPSGGRRGIVKIDFPKPFRLGSGHPDSKFDIAFTLHNQGKTRAVVRDLRIESKIAPGLPRATTTEIPDDEMSALCELDPDERYPGLFSRPQLAPTDLTHVLGGSAVLYVKGVVIYDDDFGGRQQSTFCRVYDRTAFDGAGGLVAPDKPGYNYGT